MRKNRSLSKLLFRDRRRIVIGLNRAMAKVGNTAVNEFSANFERQGFMDRSLNRWKPRKNNVDPGRAILTGKANKGGTRLRRSITVKSRTSKRVVIGVEGAANVYAGVHNYGLRAGRGAGFQMPKRQFIGDSENLNKKIVRLIKKEIKKGF